MTVNELKLVNFRNIKKLDMTPSENVNIIFGDNAQGKTNLIEAIWLFTGAKSFRGAKDSELIKFDEQICDISISFFGYEREQSAEIKISEEKKQVFLNEALKKSTSELVSKFCCSVFSPSDLNLIKGAPAGRRKFLDISVCQLYPLMVSLLSEYQRALLQRNSLLKDLSRHSELLDMLEIWDKKIAKCGSEIIFLRNRYIKNLSPVSEKIYEGITDGKENLAVSYETSITDESIENMSKQDLYNIYLEKLLKNRQNDIFAGCTTIGAHRDDLSVFINKINVKNFGSQGQQRSVVLALKLSECEILKQVLGENPVVLLDDVMSELDEKRQEYILNNHLDKQVFITCCDKNLFSSLKSGSVYQMQNGLIEKI